MIDVLRGAPGAPPITRVDVVQPVLFAMMVCVAGLWRSLGAQPTAVMGHSQGEIAAAYVAGALSLDDAARIIVERGRTLRALGGLGGMLAVPLAQDRVLADLAGVDGVSVAAINGPRSLVLSGDPDALERLRAHWDEQGVDAKLIAVDYAAHSAQIEPLREQFLERLAGIAPQQIGVAFYSTVECEILEAQGVGCRVLVPEPASDRSVRPLYPRSAERRSSRLRRDEPAHGADVSARADARRPAWPG